LINNTTHHAVSRGVFINSPYADLSKLGV